MSDEIKKIGVVLEEDELPEIPGDPPVYYTQVWLNQRFGSNYNWVTLAEDGITGWNTIYGLVRGLQIYLGLTADGDFGNGTKTAFQNYHSTTNGELIPTVGEVDTLYGIIAGALWCKGYYGSTSQQINCTCDSQLINSIMQLKSDAGIPSSNGNISAQLMKALLSMDQFVLLANYGGKSEIREIQQYLNATFGDYIGIIPCDGVYQRSMNEALIKRLQYIEGYRNSAVDGIFGNGTKAALPILNDSNHPVEAVRLFNFCLTCNGYSSSGTEWTAAVKEKIRRFQVKHLLSVTEQGDVDTWMALLLSKGNTARSALGCDCATILDSAKATALYNAGYRYVGRYVSGTVGSGAEERSKALTREEMSAIFNAGLRLFAIFQEGGVYLERYTKLKGREDAAKAIAAAENLGIPLREYIYFAVDYDVMDGYIPGYVVPYFEGINEVMQEHGNRYLIGIYGSRNVCTRICNEFGLASSSFVSDMSTGYSGNMGFALPNNWAFDQFYEYTFVGNGQSFPLDKDAVSGTYKGFNSFATTAAEADTVTMEEKLDAAYNAIQNHFQQDLDLFEEIIGPRASFTEENTCFTVPIGAVGRLDITVSYDTLLTLDKPDSRFCTYDVKNGQALGMEWESAQQIYNGLDSELKQELDLDNASLNMMMGFANSVENGKIHFGTKFANGPTGSEFIVYYIVEQYLLSTSTIEGTVTVEFELVLEDQNNNLKPAYQEVITEAAVIALSVVAIVVGIKLLVLVFAGVGIGNLVVSFLSKLAALLPGILALA